MHGWVTMTAESPALKATPETVMVMSPAGGLPKLSLNNFSTEAEPEAEE
jgi:hypothetical protein